MVKHEYEFFGPIGTGVLTFVLPLVTYSLVWACNERACVQLWPDVMLPKWPDDIQLFSIEAFAVVVGWMAFQIALHCALPGTVAEGTTLSHGKKLKYKLNGLQSLIITYVAAVVLGFVFPVVNLGRVYDNYVPLLTASVLVSTSLALICYAASFSPGRLLAEGGQTGWFSYDFWMGRELNPRVGSFDVKVFCELYPGLLGWVVINLAFLHKQWTATGGVSTAMLLVNAFHLLYVADAMWFEPSILTTMDITTDGFGFMLAFGDLTWVPFTYSLQARFLVDFSQELSWAYVAAIVALKAVGYATFRGANSQKDTFRRDPQHPSVAHLQAISTRRGRKLMVSGWWGLARHINYTGDWLMGLAWCLPCGFVSPVPYFYAIYFACLLVHRDMRDDESCRAKYGKDWDRFCSIVKYRLIPYVY